jgi:hypothetical protein
MIPILSYSVVQVEEVMGNMKRMTTMAAKALQSLTMDLRDSVGSLSENIQMIMILGTPTYAKTAHPFHLHH